MQSKLLLSVAAFIMCLYSAHGVSLKGSAEIEEDLSEANITKSVIDEKDLELLSKYIEESKADKETKDLARSGVNRIKRASEQRTGAQWCCQLEPALQEVPRPVIKARIVQKTISQGGSVKCGLFGLSRCGSSREVVVSVTEYYTDQVYRQIPAPEWTNGCPRDLITCCEGYVYYQKLKNCLTFREMEAILVVVREYQEELAILSDFLG